MKQVVRGAVGALSLIVILSLFGCKPNTQVSQAPGQSASGAQAITLLNVSYDPTRELYTQYNQAFVKYWQAKTKQTVTIQQSHGGSGKQARAVIDGLQADVVTLGIPSDIGALQKAGLVNAGWEGKLPNGSEPYTSTVVFLVRKGNPKNIHDWSDLVRPGVSVITPNPKTSSGGRWSYLAAYGYALKKFANNQNQAKAFITQLYKNAPVLDSGARGSTNTFVQRGLGDVLLAWENEADLVANKVGKGQFEVVTPSLSILAEPPVAVVDQVVDARHTRDVATAYLQYLYSPEGQEIAAENYYRPTLAAVAQKYSSQFPKVTLFTVKDVFGDWNTVQQTHFADGGIFDQIYHK